MTTSCHEQIVLRVQALLAAITSVSGLTVECDREDPVTDAEFPFVAIYEGDEQPVDDMTGERGYLLQLDIEGRADGETRDEARSNAAALRAAVQAALLADVTLGFATGVRNVTELPEPPPFRLVLDCAKPAHGFARSFLVDYATLESDPNSFA